MKQIYNTLTYKLTDPFLTYYPSEFLAIRVDGELANRKDFAAYKLKRISKKFLRIV